VSQATRMNVSWREIEALSPDIADHRISYGRDDLQFGELRLPETPGPHPVVVFIHGGCWLNQFSLDHVSAISRALANLGHAVWTPEYRRVGDAGGGWPGTFEDIAKSVAALQSIAPKHSLDLSRLILMGHSAGGHLALWLAAQSNLLLRGVISLAGICDLPAYEALGNDCAASLPGLLGGTSQEVPERWTQANPAALLPLRARVSLIHGTRDLIVPLSQSENFAKAAECELQVIKGGGHFDLVSPHSSAFEIISRTVRRMISP
jgi:acetyl esterase/lipase